MRWDGQGLRRALKADELEWRPFGNIHEKYDAIAAYNSKSTRSCNLFTLDLRSTGFSVDCSAKDTRSIGPGREYLHSSHDRVQDLALGYKCKMEIGTVFKMQKHPFIFLNIFFGFFIFF